MIHQPIDPRRDLASLLVFAAATHAKRPAFDHGSVRWTYEELAARSLRLAGDLAARDVAKGEVVAWIGENGPAAGLAYFGAAVSGAVLAPLHLRLTDADLTRLLDHARVRWILADAASAPRARALGRDLLVIEPERSAGTASPRRVEIGPDDPAHLYYTSGSTGTPKGVVLTHGNVATHASLAIRALGLTPDDVWLHGAPMFHLADAWATFAITAVGGVHRFVPKFEVGAVLDAFASGVTVTNLVPTMWNALVRDGRAAGRAYPSLRLLLSGGAAVSPDLVRRIRRTFRAEYAQTYGLTETSPYLTISRLDAAERGLSEDEACERLARVGRPMAGVEVRIAGGDSVGEIEVRGPTVTSGYFENSAATAAAFTPDGWFRTGDLARVHPDGRIDLVDRTGDVVNSGGEKVFSTDVERALEGMEGIREVCVVGTPDAHWGQVVTAVVVAEGRGVTLASIQAHARPRLADFKIPRRLLVVDALPRTASGKISKKDVRAAAARTQGDASP